MFLLKLTTPQTLNKHFKNTWVTWIQEESGQGTLEYVLLLGGTLLGVTQLLRGLLSAFDQGLLRFGAQLEKDLKTGRASLNVWGN